MTEQEVIEYLKENQRLHVIYLDLNKDVKDWIEEHRNDNKLMILTEDGDFIDGGIKPSYDIIATDVFALPDDYEVKQESEGEWVEITITDGVFTSKIECDEGESYTEDFHWWDWQGFLTKSSDYDMNYTAFGGWQYKDNKGWFTTPQVEIENGYLSNNYCLEVKPAIPVKIRFWREK